MAASLSANLASPQIITGGELLMLFVFVSNMLFGIKDCVPIIEENGRASIVCSRIRVDECLRTVLAIGVKRRHAARLLPIWILLFFDLKDFGYPIITNSYV